ncbi:hypothetical protein VPNG_09765 [Cytospora leucostoma]|uniref:Actin patches distal protein 1 n=1 Tax=Cytospora leucostoma TaxID=1230097 RepID=A0A423VLJ8_9PEZI|nr:hypothetical protein VPNG_09765 [Cytospora leucostoma]
MDNGTPPRRPLQLQQQQQHPNTAPGRSNRNRNEKRSSLLPRNMFKTIVDGAKKLALGGQGQGGAPATVLFPKVDPAVDGEECLRDCDSCPTHYPRNFKIEETDDLYGQVKGWSTHVLVATGKADWVRDVADEKGSVMQAIDRAAEKPSNGKLMLSASNIPTPHHTSDYSEPTTVLLLPALTIIENVTPANVPDLITQYINKSPTNVDPINTTANTTIPESLPPPPPPPADQPEPAAKLAALASRHSPHSALILLCSQGTRDARCGQSAPLLRKELERHLRPLGLYRDLDDERPGGVGIYFISHVGGHKYSANVMIYRRPDAFGLDGDGVKDGEGEGEAAETSSSSTTKKPVKKDPTLEGGEGHLGAAQCIWLARVKPEDIEGLVRYEVLRGKVRKPESQLRGGFDRSKGLLSW